MSQLIIEPGDAERSDVEAFIQNVYQRQYGARIQAFASRLICRFSPRGDLLCAAGLRLAGDGFFSEQYLGAPIEALLTAREGRAVRREEVLEVTTLAGRSPRDIRPFVDDIIGFGADHGIGWGFFTLTHRLSLLLAHRGLAPIPLAEADAGRLADAATWGRYYATSPKVYAVRGAPLLRSRVPASREAGHAELF